LARFQKGLGGCDGCIDHSNADNGVQVLSVAIDILKPTVEKYEPLGLTRPDIWVLASSTGVEIAMPDSDFVPIPFTTIGRQPCDHSNITAGPKATPCDPNMGTDDLVDFFEEHFGFSQQEIAAIMGAHTM
jgi:Peroxidase